MNFIHAINPLYSLSGFVVGALVGMTGVGGGSLMTPLLILVFGIHPITAVGTDLFYAAATKTGGTLFHGLARTVEWRLVALLASGSVPATALTLFVLYHFNMHSIAAEHLITTMLALALFLAAITLFFQKPILRFGADRMGELSPRYASVLTVVVGAILGVLVSVTSVGAGALGVTILLFLYPRLPIVRIVGSDIAHAVPLTLCAGIGHWLYGSIDVPLLGSLLVGSLPGIFIGSYVSRHAPEKVLRLVLAGTLILVGSKLLF
ncbi:MAG: sulfite exporter TauE/SafE family protein [Rhodospirillaceae bacterium]|nr:MAG: sulfite exporter TauE/SafE family protein [Rhodospirillaceae bacterium]